MKPQLVTFTDSPDNEDYRVTREHVDNGQSNEEWIDHLIIAEFWPASHKSAAAVISLRLEDPKGPIGNGERSDWQWVRLANGDLMLAVFPQGDGYFEVEDHVERDYKEAFNS